VAPSAEYSTVAIAEGVTDENRHEATEDSLGWVESLAATRSVSGDCDQPIT